MAAGHAYWHAATGYAPFVCITGASCASPYLTLADPQTG